MCFDKLIENLPTLLAVDGLVVELFRPTLFYLYFGGDYCKNGPFNSEVVLPLIFWFVVLEMGAAATVPVLPPLFFMINDECGRLSIM